MHGTQNDDDEGGNSYAADHILRRETTKKERADNARTFLSQRYHFC